MRTPTLLLTFALIVAASACNRSDPPASPAASPASQRMTAPPAPPEPPETREQAIAAVKESGGKVITDRVYDIRDLLVVRVESQGLPPTIVKQPAAAASAPAGRETTDMIKEISKTIMETVDPESWRGHEGTAGAIRELSGQLLISQTAANHEAIGKLLNQLRETRAVQIALESRVVVLDKATLNSLKLADVQTKFDPKATFTNPGPGGFSIPATEMPGGYLTEDQLQEVLRKITASKTSATLAEPRITCFNGHGASLAVNAASRSFISSYDAKPGRALVPEMRVINSGIFFAFEATISADRRYIITKIDLEIRSLDSMEVVPVTEAPDEKLFLELPSISTTMIHTLLSIPENTTAVIGGLPFIVKVEKPDGTLASEERFLLFLVRPRIIIQKDAKK